MKQHLSLYFYSGQPMLDVRRPAARHVQPAGHCPQHCAHELSSSLCTALCSLSVLISSLFYSCCTTRRGIPAQRETELVTDPWRIAWRPGIPTCPHKPSPMRLPHQCPQHCAHELSSTLCSLSVLISSLFYSCCTTRRGIPAQRETEFVTDPWRIARRPGIPTCPHKPSPMRFPQHCAHELSSSVCTAPCSLLPVYCSLFTLLFSTVVAPHDVASQRSGKQNSSQIHGALHGALEFQHVPTNLHRCGFYRGGPNQTRAHHGAVHESAAQGSVRVPAT